MKLLFIGLISSFLILSNIHIATASDTPIAISPKNIFTSKIFSINQDVITDGKMFEEMSYKFMSKSSKPRVLFENTIWWSGTKGMIIMDFETPFMIQDVLIQADAEDKYQIDYSMDNNSWSNLFTINPDDGEAPYGMDTMSSNSLHEEYVSNIDFSIVETKYLRISASGGDDLYLISELQVFGTPSPNTIQIQSQSVSPVPAPPSVMLFGAGLTMLMGLQYRRKKQKNNSVIL